MHVFAQYCHRRVERMALTGGRKGIKKPTVEEVAAAKVCVSGVGGGDGVYVRACVCVIEPYNYSLLPPHQSGCTIQSVDVRRGLR